MFFYPNAYFESVKQIDIQFLKQNKIKAIILDVDNTILDFNKNMPEGIKEWCEELKNQGIKFCILSNSNQKEKVKMVAEKLHIKYFYFATKPLKRGFKKAIHFLEEKEENITAIGDQIFTDVIGANRCHLFSILVKPLGQKDIFITRLKRPLENYIIKKYIRKQETQKQIDNIM